MAVRTLSAPVVADRDRRTGGPALFVSLTAAHAAVLLFAASAPVIAIGLWWNANTIAHNFIHRPFFRSRRANRVFSIVLSMVLGIPQSFWRAKHLRHHAESLHHEEHEGHEGNKGGIKLTPTMLLEAGCVLGLWSSLAFFDRHFFVATYVPGYLAGLGLCFLQGHYEHAGGTTSHYGRLYNALFFNDGYHVEHHRRPGAHWTELRQEVRPESRSSRWPPVLRWLDAISLDGLERVVLRSAALQRFVLDRHERAFRRLLPRLTGVERVTIVGGGLFPRTAMVLRRIFPTAVLTVVDCSAANLALARGRLDDRVELVAAEYDPERPTQADLVVVPLAYRGDRQRIYRTPPARRVIVHDWIWARSSAGTTVSWLLLKRLNLVER